MGKKKPATLVFDPSVFGRVLREHRRLCGYSNTREFSRAIQDKTGVFVDFDTLMKYERGEREPDVSKLLGIAFTLYGRDWPRALARLLSLSFPMGLAHDHSLPSLDESSFGGYINARETVLQSRQSELASEFELILLRQEVTKHRDGGSSASKKLQQIKDDLIPAILDSDEPADEKPDGQTPPEESDGLDTTTSAGDGKGGKP